MATIYIKPSKSDKPDHKNTFHKALALNTGWEDEKASWSVIIEIERILTQSADEDPH